MTAAAFGSARLVLTPTGPADRADIVALHADPRVTMHLLDGIPDAAWKADIYLEWAAGLHAIGLGPWTARRRDGGDFVGLYTLTPPEGESGGARLEFGGRLARAAWHGDLAVEGGAAAIGHAFGALGRDELISLYHPANPTAPRALVRLGFATPAATTIYGKAAVAVRLTAATWLAQGRVPHPPARRPGRSGKPLNVSGTSLTD